MSFASPSARTPSTAHSAGLTIDRAAELATVEGLGERQYKRARDGRRDVFSETREQRCWFHKIVARPRAGFLRLRLSDGRVRP